MKENSNVARKFLTRVLAAGALLAIYCAGTLAMTGAFMSTTVTSAQARGGYRGGGRGYRGGGRGWGRGVGFRGSRRWVCRHNGYTSGRRCFWVL
jgi:hypothetical protein